MRVLCALCVTLNNINAMKSYKFTIRGHQYDVEILKDEDNIIDLEVNGTPYKVEVHKEVKTTKTPILVRSDVKTPKGAHKIKKTGSSINQIKAPLPGNIIQVFVKENDEVKKGDKLLIYEAMKMENTVLAEREGKIKKLNVQVGDSVLQGDLLMEIA